MAADTGTRRRAGAAGLLLACVALATSACLAQEAAGGQAAAGQAGTGQAGTGTLQVNPAIALRAFEPAANEEYQLGRGDEIALNYAGHPEMDGKQTVGPDGRISLPLAGPVMLADKTREQAAQAIEDALAPYYSRISMTVGVEKYSSNRVLLLGAVDHPGLVQFDQPPTLLEALTRGGVNASGGGNGYGGSGNGGGNSLGRQTQSVGAIPERCAIYRGTDKVVWVDIKGLLESGSSMADLRLKRGDVIYVPSASERYVSVLGQVQHPGALILENNTTLAKLIAEAGGLTDLAGGNPSIQIIQPTAGTTRVITLKQMLQPGKLDLTLKSGDVVFVPESGFNRSTYALQRLSPLVTMFTAAAFFTQ